VRFNPPVMMIQLAIPLCLPSTAGPQEPLTFATGVSLVHIEAEVATRDGRILDGFTKSDFRVFDEGKEQPVKYFSAGQAPLDLILLFDVSSSMRPKVQPVADAANEGMRELRPGDRVAIMSFNSRSRLVEPFTGDLLDIQKRIQEGVLALEFRGGTFIQSAVSDAALELRKEPRGERRRAIIIITDNYGQRTRRESTVLDELWESDAVLTGLIVRSNARQTMHSIIKATHPTMYAVEVGVQGLVEKTGGDFIQSDDPGPAFRDSIHRIRSRYSIYYAMPADVKPGAHRSIRVALMPEAAKRYPGARVRTRTGYIVQ
jgi:Ca-activated chloride channel family protein